MPPIIPRYSLTSRYSSRLYESVEPFKTYYILCEGSVTEPEYFKKISESSSLAIRQNVKVIIFKRQGDKDVGRVDPISLRNFLLDYIKKNGRDPDAEYVMVFDTDVIRKNDKYNDFIRETIEVFKIRPVGTSPCIELWFILHQVNAITDIVRCSEKEIFENKKISLKHTFTSKICSELWKSNPKAGVSLYMVENVQIAVSQAQELETDIMLLNSRIGTNIHFLVQDLIEDKRFILR